MADLKVRETVEMTSPSGDTYVALWAGGTRSVKKRLAMYSFAGINGQVVDDYGVDGITYPINLIFTGENHKKDAKEFFRAFQEIGKWKVVHPTEGVLGLQGVEATENDQPVREANITRVDTQWIEYLDPVSLKTLRNALLELGAASYELEDASRTAATNAMDTGPAGVQEMKAEGVNVLDAVKQAYNKSQYAISEGVDAQEQFKDELTSAVLSVAGFISSMQNLIAAPARALADLKQRFKTFKSIFESLFAEEKDPIEPNRNSAIVKEVVTSAIFSSIAEAISESREGEENGLRSRSELLSTIQDFEDVVDIALTGLDRMATSAAAAQMEFEVAYIPFEETLTEVKNVLAKIRNALREQFFELPTEQRIILRTAMPILQLAYEYYGTVGDNDEILTKIEEANAFISNELLLIPAGTEVRLYG